MKYIVFDTPNGEAAVLFPRDFVHRAVADALAPLRPVSAGFVAIEDGAARCHGTSASLGIGARPNHDSALVRAALAETADEEA